MRGVLSYINPDTDGVGCMFGYKELIEGSLDTVVVEPRVFGVLNAETRAVLAYAGLAEPVVAESFEQLDEICLVDTHHLRQLPAGLPIDRVVEVIDHHGGGDINPRHAAVQNELVGAAATLLVERFKETDRRPSAPTALVLGAAIMSNTLELSAPSTTARDVTALRWLGEAASLSPDLMTAMRAGREQLITGATSDVLLADVKAFTRGSGETLAMSQIEAPNAALIGERTDLADGLTAVARAFGAASVIVNLADLSLGRSLLVCIDGAVQKELHQAYGVVFDASGRGWTSELFLRKTHLVPLLVGD